MYNCAFVNSYMCLFLLILWGVLMEKFSDRLKQLRKEKRLQQKEVADAVGISISTYQQYEYAKISPKQTNEAALAEFFGVSVEYLRGETDDRGSGKSTIRFGPAKDQPNDGSLSNDQALELIRQIDRLSRLKNNEDITEEEYQILMKRIIDKK